MTKTPLLLVPLVLAGAYLLLAADVKTDYNHSADFTQYHSYSVVQVKADPLWADRITRAVDGQLSAKGWNKVASGGDAAVAEFGSTKNQQTLQTFYNDMGGGWGWRGFGGTGMSTTTVNETPIGTLVVDIFDGKTKQLVWRGISSDTLSDKPEKNEKKLEKDVAEMFKKFPPRPKG